MEGSSSKGSSKRKPAFTMKIKVQSKKKLESESDNDDYDSDYSKRKPASKRDNSDYSDAESIPDLPEGTVVVKPEPVKEKKLRFSGPEFSKVPENLDIVNCTSCGRQINPNVSGAAKRHPELKVLVCRKCYSYYRSGNIEQDEDGLDEQCRWCGEGGRLLGCDHCHNAFCKSCIIRNFSRAELTTVMADDGSKWKCYVCDPSKLKKLLRECDSLFKKIEKEKLKAKTQSSIDLKKSSSSKPQKATGKSMSSKEHVTSKTHKNLVSFTNFKLNSSNVVNISTQLLGLSAGFHTMLEVLNVDLNTSGDVKNSSREANSKKDHGAKTLETGLKEFLRSLNTVLCDALKSKEKAPIENGETTEDESVLSNGHISLSDDDNSSDLSQQEIKVSWKSTSEGRQVKKGSKPEEQVHTKYRDGKKDQSKSPLRKDKMDISVDNDVFSNEVCDVDNDDSEEYDVPITFGPSDGAGDGHTISKDQNTELKADKSESQTKDDIDSVKGSRPLSETENEAAQLELLKELAEEMCKEQKERKEEKKNEEEESSKVSEKESSQQEDKKHVSGDIKARSGDSSDNDEDSSVDDSVSSSDLLMSSDSDFAQSWSMRKSKEKGPRKSQKGTDEKLEKKKMKKKRKKLKKEKEERSLQRRKEEKKLKKKKPKDTGYEDDLEKEISKLEEEPEMKKKKKPKKEKTDSDVDTDEDTKSTKEKKEACDEEKKEASDEEKKGTKTRGRKKVETSSSDDDDNEFDDEVDEDDEDDVPKMRNGKNKAPESQNGKDLENEVAKKALMAELEDADLEGDDESGNDDSESEDDAKEKKKGAKKDKKPVKEEKDDDIDNDKENDSEDEDSDAVPNKRKRIRSKLLDAKLSDSESSSKDRKSKKKVKSEDSDSEEVVRKKSKKKKSSDEDLDSDSSLSKKKKRGRKKKKQKKKRGKKRKLTSDSESGLSSSSESASDSDSEISLDTEEEERREKLKAERKAKRKAKGNKRRRIKEQKDSSDEKGKAESDSDIDGTEEDDDDDDDDGKSPDKSGRKNIRKIKSDKKLTDDTKRARKAEESRRKRVSQRQKQFNHVVQITDEQTKCPITTQLILEMDKDKKDPLIEVNKKLVRKLKPHQVEAAQFMWDCLCETTERIKKKEGSGCILAHCMGLGKTLSVITFVHTMLANEQKTTMRTCLIVCPLNTVINWRNEWTMWFDEKDQLDVYEISSVKQNWPRADYLKDWHEGGGIMIIGYEMYRNLTQSARIKNKKLKAIFQKTLVDPGPDLVVCDEGHILKNDSSAISQALNKVRTRRRVVLTGTPLQNNLLEYHCMASFVKPNLMGTRKEFLNRFVNPITNGQHSDSTAFDVKVMGRRAHVLHEMLAGCVQRRDYSALTKFLPPKFEYVISVRLSPVQIDLYEKYLDLAGIGAEGGPPTVNKGARLFSDYQNLMKIWTHPWVLKLAEIRADNKMKYDDSEDSFIDNSTDEEIASMTDNSEDSLMAVSKSDSGESEKAGPSNRSSRRSRRGKPPPEDSDKEEVVKDWKTRSRGGEDGDDRIDLDDGPKPVSNEWWAEYVKEDDQSNLDLSGKLILLFEILRMCEEIGDKVLVFSQSLLSLDIIEYFLDVIDKRAEEAAIQKEKEEEEKLKGETDKDKEEKEEKDQNGDAKDEDKKEDDNDEFVQTVFGKTWTKGADYFRMDGSTSPQLRSQWSDFFNDPENFRARLFLISTKAGSLGINLVAANRVIIFDASWNPSHDIQSIFRVYRFGQTKPCYVYRFLAQGTMEEKIYERQVTKQSLSQRVVDEHQIDRHFTSADLSELYHFKPERLDDPNCPKTTHALPKDVLLAELLKHNQQIVRFHEHDSLLENREDQTLTEEEKKAAWEEYDNERKGISNRVAQASTASGVGMFSPDNVLQIVQMVKMRFPNLPPDLFQAQVQAILQQQILYQQSMQNQQIEQQRMMEMHRLQRIQNDIRSQQRQINDLTRNRMANPRLGVPMGSRMGMPFGMQHRPPNHPGALRSILTTPSGSSGKKDSSNARSTPPNNPPVVIDLSKS